MHDAIRHLTVTAAALLLTSNAVWAQAAAKVTLVSSTVNPPSISNIYYLAAMDQAFKKHGLDVQLQQSSGSPSSLAAIVSGRAEFASIAVTTLANAAAEGVKATVQGRPKNIYSIVKKMRGKSLEVGRGQRAEEMILIGTVWDWHR